MNERKYALDILEETSPIDCKLVDMDPNVKLLLNQREHYPNTSR